MIQLLRDAPARLKRETFLEALRLSLLDVGTLCGTNWTFVAYFYLIIRVLVGVGLFWPILATSAAAGFFSLAAVMYLLRPQRRLGVALWV